MRVEMVAHHSHAFDPVIHAPEIGGVNPRFPLARRISRGVEFWRPLQKPEDENPAPMVVNRPAHDGLNREGTDLNLNGDRNAIDKRAHVRAIRSERTLKRRAPHVGHSLKRLENFHFAAAVFVAFVLREMARNGIGMREVIH